jgi:hypothetical protein
LYWPGVKNVVLGIISSFDWTCLLPQASTILSDRKIREGNLFLMSRWVFKYEPSKHPCDRSTETRRELKIDIARIIMLLTLVSIHIHDCRSSSMCRAPLWKPTRLTGRYLHSCSPGYVTILELLLQLISLVLANYRYVKYTVYQCGAARMSLDHHHLSSVPIYHGGMNHIAVGITQIVDLEFTKGAESVIS